MDSKGRKIIPYTEKVRTIFWDTEQDQTFDIYKKCSYCGEEKRLDEFYARKPFEPNPKPRSQCVECWSVTNGKSRKSAESA